MVKGYLPADFEHAKKPKVGPLKIENFFAEGVNERGWRRLEGVRSLLKPSSIFLTNRKLKF